MKTWVKLYTEILHDPDIGALSMSDRGIWMMLLTLAGELDHRDAEDCETGELDTLTRVAWHLRVNIDELEPVIARFEQLGMIELCDDVLYLPNYRKRQATPPSGRNQSVAQRVRKHRAAQPTAPDNVTALHEPVTHLEKSREDTEKREREREKTRASAQEPPPPALDSSKPLNNQPDPRPPPLQIYSELTKWYPAPGSAPNKAIVAGVSADQDSLRRWREAVTAWLTAGNSPRNVSGMLDWYRTGKRDNRNRPAEPDPNLAREREAERTAEALRIWHLQHDVKEEVPA